MQTLYYNDYRAVRRRIYLQLFDQTDGVTPEIAEAGGQPVTWTHSGTSNVTGVGVLVAADAAKGCYYTELGVGQAILLELGRHRLIYDTVNTGPVDEIIEVIPHPFLHDGLAQSGGAGTIRLEVGASVVDDYYNDAYVVIIGGTGAGQSRQITDYVGATLDATLDAVWTTQPNNTSKYIIEPGSRAPTLSSVWDALHQNHNVAGSFGERLSPLRRATAQGGTSNTITLDTLASALDTFYRGQIIRLVSGPGAGQSGIVSSYVGATKVATMGQSWATIPTSASVFEVSPLGVIPGATAPTAGDVADAVWDEPRAGHVLSNSFGSGVLLATGVAQVIADAFIKRSVSGSEDAFPSVEFALCFLAGKWTDNGDGTITVYSANDTTTLGTIQYSTRVRDAIGSIDSVGT